MPDETCPYCAKRCNLPYGIGRCPHCKGRVRVFDPKHKAGLAQLIENFDGVVEILNKRIETNAEMILYLLKEKAERKKSEAFSPGHKKYLH